MIKGGVGDYVKLQHKGKMKKEIIRIAAAIICAVVLITGSTAMNVKAENDTIIEINDLHIGDVVKAGVKLMYGDHLQGSTFCAVYYDGIEGAGDGTNFTDSNMTYYAGYLVKENTKSSQGWWVEQIEEKNITLGEDSVPVAIVYLVSTDPSAAVSGSGSDSGSGSGSSDVETEEEEEHTADIVQTPSVLTADSVQMFVQNSDGKSGQTIGMKALNPYGNAKPNQQTFADMWLLKAGTLKGSSVNGKKAKTVNGVNAKAELLWTYDLYPTYGLSAKSMYEPVTLTIKNSGAKAGDIIYVEFYNEKLKVNCMIPATVGEDGSVTCTLPCVGDVSTVSVVRIY